MQIIIPMSGFGERFRKAGYKIPKPLIEVEGKPIIHHVIDMFPGETNFTFICNEDHLNDPSFDLRNTLLNYCPTGKIVRIAPHKLGPIYAVLQAMEGIDLSQPTIVNYCDFTCYWDWQHFKKFVSNTQCDGAIPAYKGFHPHSLGTTNYAYMKEESGWVQDIQEKLPFTDNRLNEFASSGTYYFSSAQLMKEAFQACLAQELNINGEYYVSLAYKPLLASHKHIAVYSLQHFMQWGTPEDVHEYNHWSAAFRHLMIPKKHPGTPHGTLIIPMAGMGSRFSSAGYTISKPLIPVSGRSMVSQAIYDLPAATNHVFLLRGDMPEYEHLSQELKHQYPQAIIKVLAGLTEGQACTALLGVEELLNHGHPATFEPITFGACDNGVLYDQAAYQTLLDDPDIDLIVWGVRGHTNALRQPQMFGWIDQTEGVINRISVKTPLDNPAVDPIVLGTFTFKRIADFQACVDRLMKRNGRINGEFYLDSCINDALELGLRCAYFEVTDYFSWGTPNDLKTFEYWQSCFHKWASHPYQLSKDGHVPPEKLSEIESLFLPEVPQIPLSK